MKYWLWGPHGTKISGEDKLATILSGKEAVLLQAVIRPRHMLPKLTSWAGESEPGVIFRNIIQRPRHKITVVDIVENEEAKVEDSVAARNKPTPTSLQKIVDPVVYQLVR